MLRGRKGHQDAMVTPQVRTRWAVGQGILDHEPDRQINHAVGVLTANRAMTLFTSLGPSPDCMRLTQVTKYQERTGHAREATFSVLQRSFSLGCGLHVTGCKFCTFS